MDCGFGAQDPTGELTAFPQTSSLFRGSISRGERRDGEVGEGRRGEFVPCPRKKRKSAPMADSLIVLVCMCVV